MAKMIVVRIHRYGIMLHKQDLIAVLVVAQGQKLFNLLWYSAKQLPHNPLIWSWFCGAVDSTIPPTWEENGIQPITFAGHV